MGMMKNYYLQLLALCSDEQFGQDAVDWAIRNNLVPLTYNLEQDLRTIMGEPGRPETSLYDRLCEVWRRHCDELRQIEQDDPGFVSDAILKELNRSRPYPLAA